MRSILALATCVVAFGCTSAPDPDFSPQPMSIVSANTAPRGSEVFCRTYGQQTATNRAMSSSGDGRGPNGFDVALARVAGEDAYRRCLSGRTN